MEDYNRKRFCCQQKVLEEKEPERKRVGKLVEVAITLMRIDRWQ